MSEKLVSPFTAEPKEVFTQQSLSGSTTRALVIGALGAIFLSVATPASESLIMGTGLARSQLPVGCVSTYVFLILINVILKRFKVGLSAAELVIIYAMMLVASGISAFGMAGFLVPVLTSAQYYATPENEWKELFHQYIPDWMVVQDTKAIKYFFEGLPAGSRIPWGAWVNPLFLWMIYVLGFYAVVICICVIVRKQWIQRERLQFPLVQFAVELAAEGPPRRPSCVPPFFKNPAVWLGLAIPMAIHSINGLHHYYPSVPRILMYYDLSRFLTDRPFNAINWLRADIYLSVIGFMYTLPTQLSFSLWFFYFFYQVQYVLWAAFGQRPDPPFIGHIVRSGAALQMAGACFGLIAYILWRMREHLADILRRAFQRRGNFDDSDEPFPYRATIFLFIAGFFIIGLWSHIAGVPILIALSIHITIFVVMIALMRVVSEGGVLMLHTSFRPLDVITQFVGTRTVGPKGLTVLMYQEKIFMTTFLDYLMPSVLDGFKLSDSAPPYGPPVDRGTIMNRRNLLSSLCLTIILSIFFACVTLIFIGYKYGGINTGHFYGWSTTLEFFRLQNILNKPVEASMGGVMNLLFGALTVVFLSLMRQRFWWWPFHPLGFVMGATYPMVLLWFSALLGWLMKWATLRFGGISMYNKLRPFFLGMVLGEYLSGSIWIIVSALSGKIGYGILF
ncbi:hypothetical protein FJZ31_34770 [Candidatus Poribacteria bacterium]|nr:hypothetical protein [Candidatus Poribacteria bacterium]